jgi:threonine dehydratase
MSLTIEDIRAASDRLHGFAIRTPVVTNRYLNSLLDAEVFIKCENLQQIGAFKFRGAFNRLCQLNDAQKSQGVVAFSSGNHAQGIALAAQLLGMPATIVMPTDAPKIKISGTQRLGAKLRFYDRQTESREQIAADIAHEQNLVLVPAFEDLDVIAGQGTCGLEAIEQMGELGKIPELLLSPCGGGGLLAGVSTAATALVPGIKVVGIEPADFDDHYQSKLAGERRSITQGSQSFCDALLASTPGELTWSINQHTVSSFLQVSDDNVAHAISFAFAHLKLVIEPGGAVALAAILQNKIDVKGKTICVIASGGNIDPVVFADCLSRYPSP